MGAGVAGAVAPGGAPGLLTRERIVAKPGFNRWLVPPAALAIHLCIGMAYGLSVFWLPLTRALSVGKPAPAACPDMGVMTALFTTTCDWRVSDLVTVFSIGIVVLGLSAALFGGWLERAGPRKAGIAAALCWGGGFLIGALGVYVHQLWLVWLGMGLIGGIGLGLGYISPVSTLIKWFPDRRGMATGMAIMGFGGGAMIGSPLADTLIKSFRTADSAGVWQTLAVMGVGYILFMLGGAFGYRVPPAGWRPDGWTAPASKNAMIASGHVHLRDAHKTFQFWMIWLVLFLNVSAGIGVLALASPMLQEIFGGELIGLPAPASPPSTPARRRRSPRSRPASSAYSRCSTSWAGSSGPRCPIASAARSPTRSSSRWAASSTRPRPGRPASALRPCSSLSSA